MAAETITSRDNSLLRRARAVRDGKLEEAIFVEGMRLSEEALQSRLPIEAVIVSEELARKVKAKKLIAELEQAADRLVLVSESLLASVSYTKTPQGIVLLAAHPQIDETTFKTRQPQSPLLVVMHGINNPVNVGAIIRTAEAAGVTGVIATLTTSDPFSAKALRGAMGSAFRLPIWTRAGYQKVISWCRKSGIKTICADVGGTELYSKIDWSGPAALIMGPESTGLTAAEVAAADAVAKIPMKGQVESLNVGVATGILLYEAMRQRILE
ncbi:MAG TPA: RNA methyltransferase [Pyrinomonadaceae bacterium]|nr:RNA methyltransferase [Pyrinomonadaceae bacterium]